MNSIIILGDFILDPATNSLTKDDLLKKYNKELKDRNTKIETLCIFSNYINQLEGLDQSIFHAGIVPNKLQGDKWNHHIDFMSATFQLGESLNNLYKSMEKIQK